MTGEIQSIATGKKIAKKGLLFQLACSTVFVALATFFYDAETGVAVALGTMIGTLPNAVFSFFAFRFWGARQSHQVARSFSQGLKIKLAMTIGLFVVAFAIVKTEPIALFLSYFAITAAYWVVLFRERSI